MTETSTPPREDDGLSIPKHLWAAPVAEGRRCEPPPRLSRLVLLLPIAALVSAYLAAAAAAHRHVHAGGWLLGLAVTAILGRRCRRWRPRPPHRALPGRGCPMNGEPVRSTVRLWQWVWPPIGIVLAGLGVVAASVDATGTALVLVLLAVAAPGLLRLGRSMSTWRRQ